MEERLEISPFSVSLTSGLADMVSAELMVPWKTDTREKGADERLHVYSQMNSFHASRLREHRIPYVIWTRHTDP